MNLKIRKTLLKGFCSKWSKKLIALPILSLEVPLVLVLVSFGLIFLSRPTLTYAPIHSKKVIATTKTTPKVAPTVVATQPVVTSPQAVTPSTTSTTPAPAKAVTQAGTPKAEPVVTPSPSSSVSSLTPTSPTPATTPQTPATPNPPMTTGYTSTNWSGYLATGDSFTGISGSWNATSPAGNGSTSSADGTWIGIGGVTSRDLIQVGTENNVSAAGQVSSTAFYEMLPAVSQTVPGVTVSPGDSMSASILEVSTNQWDITITDLTDNESDTLTVAYDSTLSSAEWIEEDPSYSNGRQVPFDNFGEAIFTGARVVSNGNIMTMASSTAQPVTMVNQSNQTIAEPSVIGSDGESFTITP